MEIHSLLTIKVYLFRPVTTPGSYPSVVADPLHIMKYPVLTLLAGLFFAGSCQATDVTLSSNASGPAVFNATNTAKVANGSLVRIGMVSNTSNPAASFTEFGRATIRSAGLAPNEVPGKITGNVTAAGPDTTHDVFNGKTIYIWVYNAATAAAATEQGIFRTSLAFPVNDTSGIGDYITVFSAVDITGILEVPGSSPPAILTGNSTDSKHFVLGTIYSIDSDADGLPDTWETANGLNPNDPADALLDTDGDTIDNRLEHALGSDPRSRSTPGLPVQGKIQISGVDYATFQFTRLQGLTGSTLIPEISATLLSNDWHSGASDLATVSVTAQGLNEVVILRDVQPLSTRTRLYFRLRLTVP
jgi:hypothetical protein